MNRNLKLIIYKWALIAVAVLLLVFPSVADKMPQIDSRIMLTAIGLDADEKEGYELTAAVTVASGGTGGGKESSVSVSGDSVGTLMDNLSRAVGKRAELAHCAMLALGKELCLKGVKEPIEDFISSAGLSDGVSVVAASDTAKEIIETAAGLSESAAFSLGSFLSFAGEDAQVPMVSLVRFAADNNSTGGSAYLPIIEMSKPEGKGGGSGGSESGCGSGGGESGGGESGGGGNGESGSGSGEKSGGTAQIASAEKTRIFKGYKAVGEFDEKATFALTWLDPQSDRGIIKLDKLEIGGKDLGNFTFDIRKKGIGVSAKFEDDTPEVTVKVDAQLEAQARNRLAELKESGMPVMEINTIVKEKLSEQMSEQIKNGWEKAKELKADPFKYSNALFKKDPRRYDEEIGALETLFEKLELTTDVNILLM